MKNTHVAEQGEWAVVSIPGNPVLIELGVGSHLSTLHPVTIHAAFEDGLAAVRVLNPDYELEEYEWLP